MAIIRPTGWRVEHASDMDPETGVYTEWWEITDGSKTFRTHEKHDAEWLRDVLEGRRS